MTININTKFGLRDEVYHITPESPKGIITDIRYFTRNKIISYLVVWDHMNEGWCDEIELTIDKTF